MKSIVLDRRESIRRAADSVGTILREKPDAMLLLGANGDCLALYRELASRVHDGRLDLSRARFFAAEEFAGLDGADKHSCRSLLRESLLSAADPGGERSFFLTEDLEMAYDEMIAEAGGPDLTILGIGDRGRLVFNEPATPFDSVTHRQKLTKASRRELALFFGSEEQVPEYGLTVGIHTLLNARQFMVLAFGEEKADPVFHMFYSRTDSFVPAAFMQIPSEVEVYLDHKAASRL